MHPCRSVGRLLEKQYQLAAQKQNEAYLKYSYYQQTARYFERESGRARHYDSWNFTDLDFKKQLENAKKAERLICRKNQLRTLLQSEADIYRRELEELSRRKTRRQEPSLEFLKEKLKERRAEQSLYLPRTCRRYQPRFVYSTDSVASHLRGFSDSDSQVSRVCRDSTNLLKRYEQHQPQRRFRMSDEYSKHSKDQENIDIHAESHHYADENQPSLRFQARYSRKSLENTNVTNEHCVPDEFIPGRRMHRSSPTFDSTQERYSPQSDPIVFTNQQTENNLEVVDVEDNTSMEHRYLKPNTPEATDNGDDRGSGDTERATEEAEAAERDEVDRRHVKDKEDNKQLKLNDSREFESEKSLPWMRLDPHDKNLSKQMFLYLTHKELKCKIDDLSKRESHACCKQSWNEALRLRDMRNRLELIREKRLYSMENLHLNENEREDGLASMNKREEMLALRENACTDSTMYSDDAKALWKKWVREDEESTITLARAERETLMSKLEKEWQGLAIRDKETIANHFQHVVGSALQEEHKLSESLRATRAKSASSTHY